MAIVLLGLLLFAMFAGWLWHRSAPPPVAAHIRADFIGLTNNPVAQMVPVRLAVTPGATGLCAMFWITNTSPTEYQWFRSVAVEQNTPSGWQRFGLHSSVAGMVWRPGYGCLFAVGWPPVLATNSEWRLQMVSGPELSPYRRWVNRRIGWELFRPSKSTSSFFSSEVTPARGP